jgi:hypothetical protein
MYWVVIDAKLGIMGRFETGDEADVWMEGHIAHFPQAVQTMERVALSV